MNHYDQNWLQRPNVTYGRVLVIVCCWVILLLLFDQTRFAADIENKLSNPFLFRTRDQMGLSPVLDGKIKVLVVDDKSVAWMKSPELSLDQWVNLLVAIDRQKPKAIIIDKMFSMLNTSGKKQDEIQRLIGILESIETPIVVGAFVAPQHIDYRVPLNLDRDYNRIASWQPPAPGGLDSAAPASIDIKLPVARSEFAYGPDPYLRSAVRYIGHLLYDGDGKIRPVLRLSEQTVLPHFMALAADQHFFTGGGLYLNGRKVTSHDDSGILLNFSSFTHYLSKVKPIRKSLEMLSRGQKLTNVDAGDFVYIMPEFYTGSTDFKLTPFGHMPAGCAHLAMLNSIVTGKWLLDFQDRYIFVIIAAALGALVAINFSAIGVAVFLLIGMGCWLLLAVLLFAYGDLVINWLLPTLSYLFCLIAVFIEKSRVAEHKAQFIRNALDGFVAPDQLNKIAHRPETLNLEARERVVTIMFIDVVGFSLVARHQLPRMAFDTLKEVLNQIAAIVHEQGGIVNKNLGDGLLCFFGYSFEADETTLNHAQNAVACALQIQKQNLARTLSMHDRGDLVFPLRIGINTSSAYLGNLGTASNIDFTIIGNGVNFAKRLEGSCHPHMIMLGETTKELITPLGSAAKDIECEFIRIKHHNDLIKAFSLNPFMDDPLLLKKAMEAYQITLSRVKKQERILESRFMSGLIQTDHGPLKLLGFTETGLEVMAPILLIKGTMINVMLHEMQKGVKMPQSVNDLCNIAAEVVWSFKEQDGNLHEIRLVGLDAKQTDMVRATLQGLLQEVQEEPQSLAG